MSTIRIVVADVHELFEAPPFDPLAPRFELESGVERALRQLEGRAGSEVTALEVEMHEPVSVEQLRAAIAAYCASARAEQVRMLKLTRRQGRQSLWIGVPVLFVSLVISSLATAFISYGFVAVIANSLIIAGWVAVWRPSELLLYDWWPFRNRIRLLDRLAGLEVRPVDGTGK